MAAFTDAQVETLVAVIVAGGANNAPTLERVFNYVWSYFTPADTDRVGFIYSANGGAPADVNGVGAAIIAQMAIAGINSATGGIAPQLERLQQAATAYPYDRAVNPPSWQQPNLPAGAPGP